MRDFPVVKNRSVSVFPKDWIIADDHKQTVYSCQALMNWNVRLWEGHPSARGRFETFEFPDFGRPILRRLSALVSNRCWRKRGKKQDLLVTPMFFPESLDKVKDWCGVTSVLVREAAPIMEFGHLSWRYLWEAHVN